MDKPKIITVIKSNDGLFSTGDIVSFVIDTGFKDRSCFGRIVGVYADGTLTVDCSEQYKSEIRRVDIKLLKSISHAPVKEE